MTNAWVNFAAVEARRNVAAERQVHARAGRGAVHRRDHGLGRIPHRQQHAIAQRGDLVLERARRRASFLRVVHGLDVTAGAEAPAGAGHDQNANIRVLTRPEDRVVEIVAERVAEGVEALRTVQGQGGDGVLHFVDQALVVGHDGLL